MNFSPPCWPRSLDLIKRGECETTQKHFVSFIKRELLLFQFMCLTTIDLFIGGRSRGGWFGEAVSPHDREALLALLSPHSILFEYLYKSVDENISIAFPVSFLPVRSPFSSFPNLSLLHSNLSLSLCVCVCVCVRVFVVVCVCV